jgi:hypothetical protein
MSNGSHRIPRPTRPQDLADVRTAAHDIAQQAEHADRAFIRPPCLFHSCIDGIERGPAGGWKFANAVGAKRGVPMRELTV